MSEGIKFRILQKAIELFNERGFESVSMRDIAEELNISPGNLTYHFRKKTDILNGIINLLMEEHNKMNYKPEITLREFDSILMQVEEHHKHYSFYYKNIIEFKNKYPEIAQLQKDYKIEFIAIISKTFCYLEQNGWVKPEKRERLYDDLSIAVLAIAAFENQIDLNRDMREIIWSVIYPVLTEEGIKEYQTLNRRLDTSG